mmetsp:Transcript_66500/g.214291  ORF Transcript_66500/g.214291 Transcript_66500/m.214291 type:complete len:252 (-) Transcript_66500:10-765(-)
MRSMRTTSRTFPTLMLPQRRHPGVMCGQKIPPQKQGGSTTSTTPSFAKWRAPSRSCRMMTRRSRAWRTRRRRTAGAQRPLPRHPRPPLTARTSRAACLGHGQGLPLAQGQRSRPTCTASSAGPLRTTTTSCGPSRTLHSGTLAASGATPSLPPPSCCTSRRRVWWGRLADRAEHTMPTYGRSSWRRQQAWRPSSTRSTLKHAQRRPPSRCRHRALRLQCCGAGEGNSIIDSGRTPGERPSWECVMRTTRTR